MPQVNENSWLSMSILYYIILTSMLLSLNFQMKQMKMFENKKELNYFNLMK